MLLLLLQLRAKVVTMTILYAVIAHGATVLCSHQVGTGNYDMVMSNVLPNIPTSQDAKTSYTSTNKYAYTLWMCGAAVEYSQLACKASVKGSCFWWAVNFASTSVLRRHLCDNCVKMTSYCKLLYLNSSLFWFCGWCYSPAHLYLGDDVLLWSPFTYFCYFVFINNHLL